MTISPLTCVIFLTYMYHQFEVVKSGIHILPSSQRKRFEYTEYYQLTHLMNYFSVCWYESTTYLDWVSIVKMK